MLVSLVCLAEPACDSFPLSLSLELLDEELDDDVLSSEEALDEGEDGAAFASSSAVPPMLVLIDSWAPRIEEDDPCKNAPGSSSCDLETLLEESLRLCEGVRSFSFIRSDSCLRLLSSLAAARRFLASLIFAK